MQLDRYARLLVSLRMGEPLPADKSVPILARPPHYHPSLRMLRCRYVVNGWRSMPTEVRDALPRFLLVGRHRVATRQQVLDEILQPPFDPRRLVLLEEEPVPRPTPWGAAGSVRMLDQSTDHVTLEVELAAPAILLVTDSYSQGWSARSLSDPELELRLLPANYALMAVPLAAGFQKLRLEYSPPTFAIGSSLSLVGAGLWLTGLATFCARRFGAGLRSGDRAPK